MTGNRERGNYKMAQAILQATDNGEKLAPQHYRLLRLANLGIPLSPEQQKEFNGIYEQLPEYAPPWLHGVEHMTVDRKGVLCYKGVAVDNISLEWAATLDSRAAVIRIQDQCRFLEDQGVTPTTQEIYSNWGAYDEAYYNAKTAQLAALVPDGVQIILSYIYSDGPYSQAVDFILPGQVSIQEATAHPVYQDFVGLAVKPPSLVAVTTYGYGSGRPQPATQEQCDVVSLFFYSLREHGMLDKITALRKYTPYVEQNNDYGEER